MELAPMIFFIGLGVVVYLIIINAIIAAGVKAGTRRQTEFLNIQMKLMINKMIKEGYSKEEIIKIIEADKKQFWNSFPGAETTGKEKYFKILEIE